MGDCVNILLYIREVQGLILVFQHDDRLTLLNCLQTFPFTTLYHIIPYFTLNGARILTLCIILNHPI